MKKRICIILVSVLLLVGTLTSCGPYSTQYRRGLPLWTLQDAENGLNTYLLPNETFINQYSYIYGDYMYYKKNELSETGSYELSLVYMGYTNEDYPKAKQFCLDTMNLSETNIITYKSFTFYENMSLPEQLGSVVNGENTKYPHHFNMFGYSDSKNQLMFIGFYSSDEAMEITDFDAFMKQYFGLYYEFDRGVYDSTTESSTQ